MDKINDLKGINKYYCILHDCFHIRKYKYIINEHGKRIKTKDTPFFNCKNNAMKLTSSEVFSRKFRKSYNKYSIKKHKETIGSVKQ